jgi:hypothetical protein
MIGTQVSASLVWRLAISDCLVGGLRNRALDYTSSGMVGGFLAKSYGGLSYEGIYLYLNSRVEKTKILKSS